MKTIEKWVEVKAPPRRVFELFGSFENLPRWLTTVRGVERLDNRRALLSFARGATPAQSGAWDAQVTKSDPPRSVAWRAAGRGASAEVEAELEETQSGTTLLRVLFTGHSSGPSAGGLFGADQESELEAGLERFRQLAESSDEDVTLIARPAAENTIAPNEAAAGLRPPTPAPRTPVAPPPFAAARPAAAPREEKAFPPAPTENLRRAGDGRGFSASAAREPVRRRQAPFVYVGLAALLALALGALLWGVTRRQEEPSAAAGDAATPASSPIVEGETPTPPDSDAAPDAPAAASPTAAAAATTPTPAAVAAGESVREAGEPPAETQPATRPAAAARPEGDERGALKTALADWVAATNSQDVAEQMNFYAPTVERYYLRKNFSRRAVREDKTRLAERASLVNVTVGEPEVTFDREGRLATMRFRKQYSIEGSRLSRGEVVQELKWVKTDGGWRIISERDARVIR